jgi:hypothetical protein
MSRHMKTANSEIFSALDRYCASHNLKLNNSGSPRWISSAPQDRKFLLYASLKVFLNFGQAKKLSVFSHAENYYIVSIGFEEYTEYPGLNRIDLNSAIVTVVLSELKPRPSAGVFKIKDIVEFSDKASDENYSGHDYGAISDLFPKMVAYRSSDNCIDLAFKIFFQFCLNECLFNHSWIEPSLANSLDALCQLDENRIPYKVLCRSVFDGDQGSLFLALYRCMEALYSFSSAKLVRDELLLKNSWTDIAIALEDKLGWRPKEDGSLADLVRFASEVDVRAISKLICICPRGDNKNEFSDAAIKIYWLRNSLVHYRPIHHKLDLDILDWNDICSAMAGMVHDIYYRVFLYD